ncbi:hypothetical protein B0H10DRAFT_2428280 [Mycena sp. CBHHK59/15]|nr:hypothetical protein B0H10DRAFT_2428280 [Mycena sp. CBHHK59/15]
MRWRAREHHELTLRGERRQQRAGILVLSPRLRDTACLIPPARFVANVVVGGAKHAPLRVHTGKITAPLDGAGVEVYEQSPAVGAPLRSEAKALAAAAGVDLKAIKSSLTILLIQSSRSRSSLYNIDPAPARFVHHPHAPHDPHPLCRVVHSICSYVPPATMQMLFDGLVLRSPALTLMPLSSALRRPSGHTRVREALRAGYTDHGPICRTTKVIGTATTTVDRAEHGAAMSEATHTIMCNPRPACVSITHRTARRSPAASTTTSPTTTSTTGTAPSSTSHNVLCCAAASRCTFACLPRWNSQHSAASAKGAIRTSSSPRPRYVGSSMLVQ